MSTFALTIESNNDAFAVDPAPEIARILRSVADRVDQGEMEDSIQDINGNTVGHYALSPEGLDAEG